MERWKLSVGLTGAAIFAILMTPMLHAEQVSPLPQTPDPDPITKPNLDPILEPVEVTSTTRHIDVVVAIDTSGSMEKLMDSVRVKLWDIVNEVDRRDPDAELRVGLVAFGSPAYGSESGYVRIVSPLTDDLDSIYTSAWSLTTNGGDEYVGSTIKRSIEQLQWSQDENPDNRRLLFIAGNESALQGAIDPITEAARAKDQQVLVSTLFAGDDTEGRRSGWERVAKVGGGRYLSIQTADSAVASHTPYDQELERLNAQLNKSYVAWSDAGRQSNQRLLDNDARAKSLGGLAARVSTKGSKKYKVNSWDLVTQISTGQISVDEVSAEELPAELQSLEKAALKDALLQKKAEREHTQREIERTQKKRARYLREQAVETNSQGLDQAMNGVFDALL